MSFDVEAARRQLRRRRWRRRRMVAATLARCALTVAAPAAALAFLTVWWPW